MSADVLERATHSLAHRGPDDAGTTIIQQFSPQKLHIALGSCRLAILDLSPLGHQPMHDPRTGNCIVHNGEIYNFRELRNRLEQEGAQFTSNSDTEVLLKAYSQWGDKCLTQLRGMFAFAIWDARKQRLLLARDPIGVKPLYYYASDKYFLFASEVRTLLNTGLVPRKLDDAGLINYLTFGSAYDPGTLIEGINAARPGHWLVWQNGVWSEKKYCDVLDEPSETISKTESEREQTPDLSDHLREAVRLQLRSDVPLGVFLSGGIDSSSIVALLSANGVKPRTFSLTFKEPEFNEAQFSRAVARRFATDHHETTISEADACSAIPEYLRAMDQPTMDGLNTYLVSRYARAAGVKVALSGLGGDELFAGYSNFHSVLQMQRFAKFWHGVPDLVRRPMSHAFAALAPKGDRSRKLFTLAHENGNLLHAYFLSRMLFTPGVKDALFPSASPEANQRARQILADSLAETRRLDPINQISYLEMRCYMLNTLLRDADCMSMAHGLELRVPLLDQQVAKKVFSIPGQCKLIDSVAKPLLVGASASLPAEVVHRPKQGFTLPFQHWLHGKLHATVDCTLRNVASGPLGSVLQPSAVTRVWQDFLRGRTAWSRPWSLYVLQRWSEMHLS